MIGAVFIASVVGSFVFLYFLSQSSAFDHSATAPPFGSKVSSRCDELLLKKTIPSRVISTQLRTYASTSVVCCRCSYFLEPRWHRISHKKCKNCLPEKAHWSYFTHIDFGRQLSELLLAKINCTFQE